MQYELIKLRTSQVVGGKITGLFTVEENLRPSSLLESCKVIIGVCMYNESKEHLTQTLDGVCSNLKYFSRAGVSPAEVACVVVADGMEPFMKAYNKEPEYFSNFFSPSEITLRYEYDEEDLPKFKHLSQGKDEIAHCFYQRFECSSNAGLPLNLYWCVKQENKRKLNSHLWFFGGFCEELQPEYCIILDVGTKPQEKALFYLFEAMETDPQVAGCCGEIVPTKQKFFNFVVSAQVVEYKFAHIFDKALESITGYITVLPGAFSAYRWSAIKQEPLWDDYFKSIMFPEDMNAFNSNIYLAEDRVLCHSLVTKENCSYILRYVKKALAFTDVPETLGEILGQRRRWVNGSWFAMIDSLNKYSKLRKSSHSFLRQAAISFLVLYHLVYVVFSWLMVGTLFLVLFIQVKQIDLPEFLEHLLVNVYIGILIIIFTISLGVKPRRVEPTLQVISFFLGLYMAFIMTVLCYFIFADSDSTATSEILSLVVFGTLFAYPINIVVHGSNINILKGIVQYIFMTPTYINLFLIYSICNVHDCTWGNRPDKLTQSENKRLEEYEQFRTRWVVVWLVCNIYFPYSMIVTGVYEQESYWISYSFFMVFGVVLLLKFLGGILYFFQEKFKKKLVLQDKEALFVSGNTPLTVSPDIPEAIDPDLTPPQESSASHSLVIENQDQSDSDSELTFRSECSNWLISLLSELQLDVVEVEKVTGIPQSKLLDSIAGNVSLTEHEKNLILNLQNN